MPKDTFLNLPNEKQQRILKAAIDEFAMRNIETANIANIIKNSNISRGSFYQYFTSKEDLFVYIIEKIRCFRKEYSQKAFEIYKVEPFLEFFKRFRFLESEYLWKNPLEIKIYRNMYASQSNLCKNLIAQLYSRNKDCYLAGIEYDKSRGIIRETVDSVTLAEYCVHLTSDTFLFQSALIQSSHESMSDSLDKLIEILHYGVMK
ncbi:MAG: TetR/AcrR family transcriptional regulator [Eubacteriaceae bacterium]